MKINLVNENSVIIYFSDTVSIETADRIAYACHLLRNGLATMLSDIVPSYTSILLSCNLRKTGLQGFVLAVKRVLEQIEAHNLDTPAAKQITLPVYYGEEVALDYAEISEHVGLPFSEVVKLHTSECYRVFAIGFAPGFAYLGNTPESMTMPRKMTPRAKVPKGSVAIADQQTAVYPRSSPGGWQVIGRTPVNLLDFSQDNLSQFSVGEHVRFEAIDRVTFLAMGGEL
ncbi:5-oxoprolinase subunit B family protein [Psychromonas sp.]|uniref:5-oxoprolinase subunit B family protein n=1 Tax=Psychromonas sp. TaxID=1884585 RepID=UPI003A97ADC0